MGQVELPGPLSHLLEKVLIGWGQLMGQDVSSHNCVYFNVL